MPATPAAKKVSTKAAKKAVAKAVKKPAPKPPKNNTGKARQRFRARTYRHGLGDCHLLTFTKEDGSPLHMLIDCGIVDLPKSAKDQTDRMIKVVQNIVSETTELDIVVATHQHTDHLSGFRQASAEFDKITMKRLWFAWTERKGDPLVKQVKEQVLKKLTAVEKAVRKLAGLNPTAASHIQGVLDFFGGPAATGDRTQAILDALEKRVPDSAPDYYEPGMVFPLPGVPNVRVYVLGPPKDPAALRITNPRSSKKEGYELTLAAAANGLTEALLNEGDERSQPFDKRYRKTEAEVKDTKDPFFGFFQDHYFKDSTGRTDPAWRKIDSAWLEMAEQLALALNDFTNNTSLALAFEFIDTQDVLLFPGDAQIGSWLTWSQLVWKVQDEDGTKREVRIGDLFARTIFYKAAHHASHNGTLSGLGLNHIGLEQMTDPRLVCVVPVDVQMSKDKHWDRTLPWEPLLKRLREKTRGRLILTDASLPLPAPASLKELSPSEIEQFTAQVQAGTDHVTGMGFVDYTLFEP